MNVRWSSLSILAVAVALAGVAVAPLSSLLLVPALAQAPAAQGRAKAAPAIVVEPRAPASVKEGGTWVPPLPSMEEVAPPTGWKPSGEEQPPMPLTLLRLPRTNVWRAKYPAIDFHVHARGLTSKAAYDELIALMDDIGMGAIVNLNGGTGKDLDAVLAAGAPYKDRVANFITFSADGINEPGWSERFAAEMERAFKAGAMGMKVSKQLGQGAKNPDGTFIQADDPRLDAVWAMAAKYDKPVMIHTSDSIGRFYPIGPKNERFEAGSVAPARRDCRQPAGRRPVAPGHREGARAHAPQASEDALRERAHGDALLRSGEARDVPGHLPERRHRTLGDLPGSGPRAAPAGVRSSSSTRIASSSAPTAARRAAPTSSGVRTGARSRPWTSTFRTRRRCARPADHQVTAAGTSQASACPTPCCARSTTATPCATCRRCAPRSRSSSLHAA